MGNSKQPQFEKACKLFTTGMTRKEVSTTVGVSEKTAGKWFKTWKQETENVHKSIKNIKARLLQLTANENTPVQDIKDLAYSLDLLQRNL